MSYYQRCLLNATFLAVSFMALPCSASEFSVEYPNLIMHGETYSNACEAGNQEELRSVLFKNEVKAPTQAWKLINVILCSPNDVKNRAYVTQMVQKKLRMKVESTGERPDVKTVDRNEELVDDLLAAGRAWQASIRVEPGRISLQYFANEACVEAIAFSFRNGKWLVNEFGVACD